MNIDTWQLHLGNCKELIKDLEDNSIDSIVTDPPYELGFMGKKWDNSGIAYDVDLWTECLRVLKPGGHLLAFSGSRTYHRMAVAIEDAGFDIRDQIMWIYGSGFPKSHNIGKAVDRLNGAYIPKNKGFNVAGQGIALNRNKELRSDYPNYVKPKYDNVYDGWGTALKPAHEPICVARKPLIGTVAENVLQYGTGAFNIDGCRVGYENENIDFTRQQNGNIYGSGGIYGKAEQKQTTSLHKTNGRWPANLIHDGSEEVLAGFPDENEKNFARFFYCAKASKKDRNEGCDGFELKIPEGRDAGQDTRQSPRKVNPIPRANHHPTVKPTDLMRYLCRLVTPPNGLILDPFTGSGSTGKAAILEGFRFLGFDMQSEYIDIASARIKHAEKIKDNKLFD